MKGLNASEGAGPFASLQRLARARRTHEVCDLCGAEIAAEHPHLFEPEHRALVCACTACSLLFDNGHGRYRCVPRRIERLVGFRMSDVRWEGLHVPIDLAFFFHSTPANSIVALYPSPAGVTECAAAAEAWAELAEENPVLRELAPDVEALLVNRLGLVPPSPPASGGEGSDLETRGEYFRAPIDDCFRLAGLLRRHWRGLSGGTEVWKQMSQFFTELRQRAEERHV
jgi:hypothetical protein